MFYNANLYKFGLMNSQRHGGQRSTFSTPEIPGAGRDEVGDCQSHVLNFNWFSAALPIHLNVFGITMKVDAVVFCFLIGKAEHMLQLSSETDKVEK